MPFVTETTKVFLIVPIHSDEQAVAIRFLHHANKTLFEKETQDKFELLLTHIVTTKQELAQSPKWFEVLQREINLFRVKRPQLKVAFHTILLPSSSLSARYLQSINLLEFFEIKLRADSLLFLTDPYVDIEADFLNRCRLNVIEGVQVFFPIAFYQYHPRIIMRSHNITENSTIELHKAHGWFNSYAFDHIGLYMRDYSTLKKTLLLHNVSMTSINLYDSFVQLSDIQVLRAPDQSLRVHHQSIKCDQLHKSNAVEHNRCLMQKEKGIASRSQLAMAIIENEQTSKSTITKE